ncbi:MAG: DctP family TRAP transporter solute-binding subunit [Methylobacteriaceae bacterium]|jgi:tripartite ATP-independent transporter DctP family solute receptor|nr:DctP family TRAP transporter solute-binding subunit [Methylobacteriaceae bacterium]
MTKLSVSFYALTLAASVAFAGVADAKTVLRWGSVHADSTVTTQMMMKIIKDVNEKAKDVEIQGYPNSVLGGSRDLVEGVQAGITDMISEGPAQFASWIPLASIAEAPYIYRSVEHMNKALNGPFMDKLNEEFLKKNTRMLGAFYYGTRQLTTTNKEIKSVKDMAGLKIRVPEVKAYVEMINAWNAKATPIPFGDLYMSLQTNVVDGQENPLTTFAGQKFYEVQKYVILTDHIICPNMIFINEDAWKKVSPEDQKVIEEAVKAGIAWNDEEVKKSEEALKKDLAEKGVTIVTPDVDSFREVTAKHLVPLFADAWGKDTWDFIQNIK